MNNPKEETYNPPKQKVITILIIAGIALFIIIGLFMTGYLMFFWVSSIQHTQL